MKNELKKDISFFPALATVVGTVIGSGVFFKAATVYGITGNAQIGLFAWLLGGIISICAGLTGAELAAAMPETGGMMVYIERTYGKLTAFLLGWAQTIVYVPASMAGLAIIFATQIINLFSLSSSYLTLIAIGATISIVALNFLGSKIAGSVQAITTFAKLIPIFLIIIFGFFHEGSVEVSLLPTTDLISGSNATLLGNALIATLFSYDGWILVGNIAGEMKNPKKDLPKSIAIGLVIVMAIYLLINIAFLKTLPLNQLASNPNAPNDVASILFGDFGGKIITVGILISVYGGLNGFTMTGMRIPYAMAKRKSFPFHKWVGKISGKAKVPCNASLLILLITCIMIATGSFDLLTDMLVFVIWIFYILTFLGVFILRKREPNLHRPYKVPFFPIVPLIAISGGLFVLINTLITQTGLALTGICLTLLGIPIYYYQQVQNKKKP